jgi:hypothetical protein
MLIPTSKNRSSGRLAPSPFEFGSARVSVDGAVVRGVAVAPRMPPDLLGDGAGVPLEDAPALGEELGGGLGEELGGGLGEELGGGLGEELGGGLGLGDGQDGTVLSWITEPLENVTR